MKYSFLAGGKMYLGTDTDAPVPVESKFANDLNQRALEIENRSRWKSSEASMINSFERATLKCDGPYVRIGEIMKGSKADELLYVLRSSDITALTSFDCSTMEELRLFHSNLFEGSHLVYSSEHKSFACSLPNRDKTESIGILESELTTRVPQAVTCGDSIDLAPSWIPGKKRKLVYQSAGIARGPEGHIMSIAPFSILEINIDEGTVEELVSDPSYDALLPRMTADGMLYYIRKPVQKRGKTIGINEVRNFTVTVIKAPFRIARASIVLMDLFTTTLTGKSILTNGDRKLKESAPSLLGYVTEIDNFRKDSFAKKKSEPVKTPDTCELIALNTKTKEVKLIAKGVINFDVNADGSILYCSDSAIHAVLNGDDRKIWSGLPVEAIALLD